MQQPVGATPLAACLNKKEDLEFYSGNVFGCLRFPGMAVPVLCSAVQVHGPLPLCMHMEGIEMPGLSVVAVDGIVSGMASAWLVLVRALACPGAPAQICV